MAFSRSVLSKFSTSNLNFCCSVTKLKTFQTNVGKLSFIHRGTFLNKRHLCSSSSLKSEWRKDIMEHDGKATPFRPKKAIIVSKMSRFEFDRRRYTNETDTGEEIELKLRKVFGMRGSDYEKLLCIQEVHTDHLKMIVATLEQFGIDVQIIQRQDYTADTPKDADLVISAGGDGTFLMAASKVLDDKPMLGINTDPSRSEGYLCLPSKYSTPEGFVEAMKKISSGKFKWKWRQRIRATIECGLTNLDPIDLHEEELSFPENHARHTYQQEKLIDSYGDIDKFPKVLPVRALNEVFMGESLSSRASYYEMSIDGGPLEKQKSSGITICTGTGSTSWTYNINKLPQQSVQEILQTINKETGSNIPLTDELAWKIARQFNDRVLFDASEPSMVYTIRDPIINGIYQQIWLPRGFARRIMVRSRCFDACLVMDGGSSFIFNDGAIATLETKPEDALRTFELDE